MLVSIPFGHFVQRITQMLPRRRRSSRLRITRSSSCTLNIAGQVQTLENRAMLSAAAVVVNSVSGTANYASNVTIGQLNPSVTAVTLVDAIDAVNNTPGAATISFDPTVFAGQQTIHLGGSILELSNSSGRITIQGSTTGQVSISGDNLSGVFKIDSGVDAKIVALMITNGMAEYGGGIENSGTLVLDGDAIVGNNADASTTENAGGGIANSGNLTLIDTTVAGNNVSGGTTFDGGGGIGSQSGNVIIIDSTIANNTAVAPSGSGAGVAVGGGLAWLGGNQIKLYGSILAGNTTDVVGSASATGDYYSSSSGLDASSNYDLVGDGTGTGLVNGTANNIVGTSGAGAVNAQLDALANYGGPTPTLALAATSPAIGAGANFDDPTGTAITVDQRGIARVSGSVDIGAYQTAAPTICSIGRQTPSANATNASSVTFQITFSMPVQNVSASDFTVNTGTIASVTPVSASIYNVSVSGLGSFTGTLTLKIAAGQNITDLTGLAMTVTTPTGTNNNTFAVDHSPPASVAFAGEYAVATQGSSTLTLASIRQSGTALTLIGLTTTAATVTNPTTLTIGGVTATYGDDVITFGATGPFANQVWTKLSLPTTFTNQRGAPVSITQNGSALTFTDNMGVTAPGTWVSPSKISAYGETATIANGQLIWADGSIWNESIALTGANGTGTVSLDAFPSQLTIVNYTTKTGASVHVIEYGTAQVIMIDKNGGMGVADFYSPTVAEDSSYPNDLATFSANGKTVTWQDGTVWTLAGTSGQVTITDYVNSKGVATHLVTDGTSNLAFLDSLDQLSLGAYITANTAISYLYPNDVLTIGPTTVTWQDGSVWTKTVVPQTLITVLDTNGAISHLQLVNASTVVGLDGALLGVTGTRLNGKIYWSNGEVWNNFNFDALNAFFEMRATYP